jgi:3-phosphoshikimate 1-carboxyvinyltransferase
MHRYSLRKIGTELTGTIPLTGSKSISNRALIIRALSPEPFPIHKLADARDTRLLRALLESKEEIRDAGAAGTTFRFLTAYLALQPGTQVLTGTKRMKQRPIGLLVEALQTLGAQIEYLEKPGYPPLRIGPPAELGKTHRISIPAGTSSQYVSALLMIAPTLPGGLELTLKGTVVSRPYIEMTLRLMQYFGVTHKWEGEKISVPPQAYRPRPFTVEADWSAASYFYAMAAFAEHPDLQLNGLFTDSVQGDAVLAKMMDAFGIQTTFNETGIHLSRREQVLPDPFRWDFLRCPDLAQTLAVICGGMGVRGQFTGLETLRIKETDRIDSLQRELQKIGVDFKELPTGEAPEEGRMYFEVSGRARVIDKPVFATYEDHRMAMAFAPLAMLGEIAIKEPMVVEKSYPDFYKDLKRLGFEVTATD